MSCGQIFGGVSCILQLSALLNSMWENFILCPFQSAQLCLVVGLLLHPALLLMKVTEFFPWLSCRLGMATSVSSQISARWHCPVSERRYRLPGTRLGLGGKSQEEEGSGGLPGTIDS